MKVDFDKSRIKGKLGEKIKIQIESRGTEQKVIYKIGGEQQQLSPGEIISIKLPESEELSMLFDFSEDFGGAYAITVTGAGEKYEHTIKQLERQGPIRLALGLEGDPTIDL